MSAERCGLKVKKSSFYNLTDFLGRLRSLVTARAGRLHANGRLFSVDKLT